MSQVKSTTIMNMRHFHDFYFLQAMEAAVKMEISANPELEFQKPVEKFLDELDTAVDKIIPNMAQRTFMYLWAASFGEARHAKDTVAKEFFLAVKIPSGRGMWFSKAVDFQPTKENIASLMRIFEQDWRSGYGGEAWANIVEALSEYEKTPPAAWLDHVVDLEHNNGTAFSKPEGEDTIFFSVYYPARFSSFLDYKFAKDILVKKPSFTDYLEVTPKVYSLLNKYSTIFNKPEVKHVKPELDSLSEYVVEWGKGVLEVATKWHDWASIGRDNKPSVSMLLSESGLYDFYCGYYTKEKFLEKVAACERRALAKVNSKYATKYFVNKVKKEVAKFVKENSYKCKLDKAKTTYTIMPCTVVQQEFGKITLKFSLPYQEGYGVQDGDGFTAVVDLYADRLELADAYIERRYGDAVIWLGSSYHYVSSSVVEALLD